MSRVFVPLKAKVDARWVYDNHVISFKRLQDALGIRDAYVAYQEASLSTRNELVLDYPELAASINAHITNKEKIVASLSQSLMTPRFEAIPYKIDDAYLFRLYVSGLEQDSKLAPQTGMEMSHMLRGYAKVMSFSAIVTQPNFVLVNDSRVIHSRTRVLAAQGDDERVIEAWQLLKEPYFALKTKDGYKNIANVKPLKKAHEGIWVDTDVPFYVDGFLVG